MGAVSFWGQEGIKEHLGLSSGRTSFFPINTIKASVLLNLRAVARRAELLGVPAVQCRPWVAN